MTVAELIEILRTKDPTAEVHIPRWDGDDIYYYGKTDEAYQVQDIIDERGYALPGGPTEHKAVLICTGLEGL